MWYDVWEIAPPHDPPGLVDVRHLNAEPTILAEAQATLVQALGLLLQNEWSVLEERRLATTEPHHHPPTDRFGAHASALAPNHTPAINALTVLTNQLAVQRPNFIATEGKELNVGRGGTRREVTSQITNRPTAKQTISPLTA